MTDTERRKFYSALIAKQRSSSLSVPDFCKRNHISAWSFYQWRKSLSASRDRTHFQPAFLPVPMQLPPVAENGESGSSAEIILESGIRLRVPAQYPPHSVRALLSVLLEQ
jgi:hypothetical protein